MNYYIYLLHEPNKYLHDLLTWVGQTEMGQFVYVSVEPQQVREIINEFDIYYELKTTDLGAWRYLTGTMWVKYPKPKLKFQVEV